MPAAYSSKLFPDGNRSAEVRDEGRVESGCNAPLRVPGQRALLTDRIVLWEF
jgi:hypothetical protein